MTFRSRLRPHLPFACVFALAALVRLWGLGWLPSPAGDEGTWARLAERLARGDNAGLYSDASFVTTLCARAMALCMRALGPTVFAARLPGVLGALSAVVAAYAVLAALRARRAALAAACVLAVHPWSVLWSRTASVPYALALASLTAGPLLFAQGVRARRPLAVVLGIQLLALGAQFSPLAIVGALACALYTLPRAHRWALRDPATWVSVALAAAHALPVVRAASRVAQQSAPRSHLDHFGARLASYLHMTLTGTAGEATLRHFTHAALSPRAAWVLAVPVALVVLLALGPAVRRASPLPGFGPLYFLVAWVLMPLVLAPGRDWQLEAIDTDRYLFVLLPGFALCVGDLAQVPRTAARLALVAATGLLALGTARAGWAFVRGGGPDRGLLVAFDGGAYRGWRVAREHAATTELVREAALRDTGGAAATVWITDWAFHPLRFAATGTPLRVRDVRAPGVASPEGATFYLLWSDAMFSAPGSPRGAADENAALRARMRASSNRPRLVRALAQPDGTPLLELWRADPR